MIAELWPGFGSGSVSFCPSYRKLLHFRYGAEAGE